MGGDRDRGSVVPLFRGAQQLLPLLRNLRKDLTESTKFSQRIRSREGRTATLPQESGLGSPFAALAATHQRPRPSAHRGLPDMTLAKFSDFLNFYPLSPFGTDLHNKIHAASLTTSAFP